MPFFLAALAIPLLKAALVVGAASIAAKVVGKATGSKTLVKLGKVGMKVAIAGAIVGAGAYAYGAMTAAAPLATGAAGAAAPGAAAASVPITAVGSNVPLASLPAGMTASGTAAGAVTQTAPFVPAAGGTTGLAGAAAPVAASATPAAAAAAPAVAQAGYSPYVPQFVKTAADTAATTQTAAAPGLLESAGKFVTENPLLSFMGMSTGGSILSSLFAGKDAKKARKQQAQAEENAARARNTPVYLD